MRVRVGAWLWIATGLQLVAQAVAAARWPEPYSLRSNAISDLGVTTCGTYDEGGRLARAICSPWHAAFNGGMVVTGLLLAAGSLLLLRVWPGRRSGAAAMIATAVAGVLVALVGLVPWDRDPDGHDLLALGQSLAQWAAMVLLVLSTRRQDRAPWPAVRRSTGVVLALSVAAFVAFVAELDGTDVPWLAWGVAERLAFDTLTLWTVLVGVLLLRAARVTRPDGAGPLVRPAARRA